MKRMAGQSMVLIAAAVIFPFLLNICDALTEVHDHTINHLNRLLIMSTTNMTNPRTCRDAYDHCVNGNVTGDGGVKSPSSDKLPPARMTKEAFSLSRCFCDVTECRKYGDCCPDIVISDIQRAASVSDDDDGLDDFDQSQKTYDETNEISEVTRDLHWECHGLMVYYKSKLKHISIYMSTSCPLTWRDAGVDDLCHRRVPSPSLYDYTLDVPVISHATNTTYRNIYCAICNGDTAIVQLAMSVHCPEHHQNCSDDWSQWDYVAGQQRWRHVTRSVNKTFEIVVPGKDLTKFFVKHGIRKCASDVLVNTCPRHWSGTTERRLCAAYALMMSDRQTGALYKNKHCALCNGIAENASMSCPTPISYKPDYSANEAGLTHSYSMLVDFMGSDVQRSITCGYGEICDVLRKRCRPFTCGHHFLLDVSGRCTRAESTVNSYDLGDQLFILVDCPKVTFYGDQFVFLSNNTIYVNETDTIYNMSDYEMVNETVVLVCASTSSELSVWKFTDVRAILSTVCVIISLSCLGVHILVHVYVPQLRNLPGKNLLSLSGALFVAQFLFAFGMTQIGDHHGACIVIAVVIHLCFLATFFWMNVMAFDVCRTFSSKSYLPSSSGSNSFFKYSLYAWLMPSIIVALALTNDIVVEFLPGDIQPGYARDEVCWIKNHRALLVFFVAPLALLITKNMVLFVATVVGISRTTRATRFARKDPSSSSAGSGSNRRNTDKIRIVLYIKLALIMGLTWVFGLVASLAKVELLWYLFIVFNGLQGAFIFFAFTFKRKILRLAQDRYRGKKMKSNSFNRTQVTSKSMQSTYIVTPACVPAKS